MPIIVNPAIANPEAPTVVTSTDGVLTAFLDPANAGVRLRADFSYFTPALPRPAHQARFQRLDGTPVRSGDPAYAVGGLAYAYDHESGLGDVATYSVTVLYSDGTEGPTSLTAAILIPDPTGLKDVWLKSVNDPGLSMRLSGRVPAPAIGTAGRLRLVDVPGSAYPVGSYDRRTPSPVTLTLRLDNVPERKAYEALLASGPVYAQMPSKFGEDDMYVLAGESSRNALTTMKDIRRDVTVTLHPVRRPPTVDAALFVPGFSIDEVAKRAPTINDVAALYPTIEEASGFSPANSKVVSVLDLRWRIEQKVASDLDLRWRVNSSVASDLDLRWQIGVDDLGGYAYGYSGGY